MFSVQRPIVNYSEPSTPSKYDVWKKVRQPLRGVKVCNHGGCLRTILRAEKLRIGSSAARETELSMMKTKMRLVKIWWLISLWQKTRNLQGEK